MSFHYKFNASSAHRWLKCLAYKTLEGQVPEREAGEAAIVGTAAHYLGEWAIKNGYATQIDERMIGMGVRINSDGDAYRLVTGPGLPSFIDVSYSENPLETSPDYPTVIPVDEDMIRGVSIYTGLVTSIIAKYENDNHLLRVEQTFQLHEDMGGSTDCVIVTSNRIVVIDYKNGRTYVDAKDNAQLAMYAVGAIEQFEHLGYIKDVVMCIVQPNATKGPSVKTWTQTREQIFDWRQKFFDARNKSESISKAFDDGSDISQLCTTGSHCQWCPASYICPAMHSETKALAKSHLPTVNPSAVPMPHTIPDDKLLWIANHADAIIHFVNSCKDHMLDEALKGKLWPGHKLVEKPTKRRLANVPELTKKLKHEDKMDGLQVKPVALSKLEKLYGKEYMAPFVERPKGALELVRDKDPRQEHNQSLVAMMPKL